MRLPHFVPLSLLALSLCFASASLAGEPAAPALPPAPEAKLVLERMAQLERKLDRALADAVERKLDALVQRHVDRENERLVQRYWGGARSSALVARRGF